MCWCCHGKRRNMRGSSNLETSAHQQHEAGGVYAVGTDGITCRCKVSTIDNGLRHWSINTVESNTADPIPRSHPRPRHGRFSTTPARSTTKRWSMLLSRPAASSWSLARSIVPQVDEFLAGSRKRIDWVMSEVRGDLRWRRLKTFMGKWTGRVNVHLRCRTMAHYRLGGVRHTRHAHKRQCCILG